MYINILNQIYIFLRANIIRIFNLKNIISNLFSTTNMELYD